MMPSQEGLHKFTTTHPGPLWCEENLTHETPSGSPNENMWSPIQPQSWQEDLVLPELDLSFLDEMEDYVIPENWFDEEFFQ